VSSFFDTPIEFLKGVGPQRSELLKKELSIFTYGDLLQHYPFRHEDRTKVYAIGEVNETMPNIQLRGRITGFEMPGIARKKRLVGYFTDGTGEIELVWFQGINWVKEKIKAGVEYVVFGKPNRFGRKLSIAHPEIEPVTAKTGQGGLL
jgi:ATP-dependent DNA helicase RecG